MKKVLVAVVCVVAAFVFGVLGYGLLVRQGDYVPLPRGYRYFRSPAGVILELDTGELGRVGKRIADDSGLRVGPHVDGYRVFPGVIVGHVSRSVERFENPAYVVRDQQPVGYFVIDYRKDLVYEGLSREAWLKWLRVFGIEKEPGLFVPAWYDEWLGRNRPEGARG